MSTRRDSNSYLVSCLRFSVPIESWFSGEGTDMKKLRFNLEKMVGFFNRVKSGDVVKDLCRRHGFSDPTFYNWRSRDDVPRF
jgi:hypothetical protein